MIQKPETAEQLYDWCRSLVDDGRNMRRGHETMWWQNIATYAGDLWAEFNPHTQRLEETVKPDHRVRLAINLSQPVVRTEYAKLLKNKPIVDCIARSDDKSDLNAAKTGDKLLNNYIERQFHMPRTRRQAVMWCLLTGMGTVFTDYDPSLLGEVEVLYDPTDVPVFDPRAVEEIKRRYAQMEQEPNVKRIPQGDLRMAALSPMQLIWDFSKMDPIESAWCIVTEVFDCVEVERRWGIYVEPSKNVKPNVLEQRFLSKVDLTHTLNLDSVSSQDLVEIHRLFVKPGHLFFPQGAEIAFTDDEIIDADNFPHTHGQLPVATMGHVPLPSGRFPMSILSQIKDPVLELSKTESQLVENRNLMANPPWLEYDIHGLGEDAIQNKPGLRIKVQWRPGVDDPHPIQMPEVPAYVQNLPPMLKEHILEISGQGETSQGRVPPGARSGVAIAYLQEEDDTRLGPTVTELEEMSERVAWQQLQVIAQRYDTPRTIHINKRNSDPEVLDFIGTMLGGVAGVNVQAGSALPRSKAAKQQYILDLYDRGIETDPRRVREMLELAEGEPEEWELDIQQAERENSRLQQGLDQPVEEWYNHQAHHLIHRRFMKSADYESLDEEVKRVIKNHDALHDQLERQQQIKQAALQAVTGGATAPTAGGPAPNLANGTNNQAAAQGGFIEAQSNQPSLIDAQPQ